MIYKDNNNELTTIDRFKAGDIVGAEQILCGTKGIAIKASTDLEAKFILKDHFLDYLKNNLLRAPHIDKKSLN